MVRVAVLQQGDGAAFGDAVEAVKAAGAMDEKTKNAVSEAFRLLGGAMIGGVPAWIERKASDVAQKMPPLPAREGLLSRVKNAKDEEEKPEPEQENG